ncbi:MAG: metallophosphoesterase [Thermodesulfobacteriota bacterium]
MVLPSLTRRQFLRYGTRLAVVGLAGKGFYNTTSYGIELTRVPVTLPNLPPVFKGFKIALLSDIHSSFIVSKGLIAEAARLAMGENPDLIVLGGDFISGETKLLSSSVGGFDRKYLDQCIEAFSTLEAPMGIFGVLGNHEFWSGEEALGVITEEFSKRLGVRWLRNESTALKKGDDKIDLLGIDDYWHGGSIIEAMKGVDEEGVRVLLSHNPDVNEEIDLLKERVDLVLSGHTHGGQICLPFFGAPFIPSNSGQKYRAGLVRDGERQTYITRGVGNLLAPIRLNALPEVAVVELG